MSEPKRRDVSKRRRRNRTRPLPKWLQEKAELDEMARRRCLLILSVLAGEKPVSDAIAEAKLSRNTYYQLEEKAIYGMLAALGPVPPGRVPDQSAKLSELEAKVTRLEQEKRRTDRLLFLTRKVVRTGRLTLPGLGRPPSTRRGGKPSSSSPATTKPAVPASPSSPRSTGAAAP